VALAAPAGSAAASNWTLRQLPPRSGDQWGPPLSGVSCPTESLCVAVGGLNTLAFSQAPTGGVAKWHVVGPRYPVGPGKTCVEGEAHCPEPGGRLQSPTVINEGDGATHLTAVSCPSPALCVAVSGGSNNTNGGKVLTSTNPIAGQWQVTRLGSSLDLRGISCGTPSLCVAVVREGRIFVSTNPTAGASARRPHLDRSNGRRRFLALRKPRSLPAHRKQESSNPRGTRSSPLPAPRPRSAPWSASTAASSPRRIPSQCPPTHPVASRSGDPARSSSSPSTSGKSPPPATATSAPASASTPHPDEGLRMQARPRSLPSLPLPPALPSKARPTHQFQAAQRRRKLHRPVPRGHKPAIAAVRVPARLCSSSPYPFHQKLPAPRCAPQ
jgi:hypothetical protein